MSKDITKEQRELMVKNLIYLRKKKGVTKYQVAKDNELSPSTMTRLEKGERYPSYQLLLSLSNYYDIPIAYFNQDMKEQQL